MVSVKLLVLSLCAISSADPQSTLLGGGSSNFAAIFPIQFPFVQQQPSVVAAAPQGGYSRVIAVTQQSEIGGNVLAMPAAQPNAVFVAAQPPIKTVKTIHVIQQPAIKAVPALQPTVVAQKVYTPTVVAQPVMVHHVVATQPQTVVAAQPQIIAAQPQFQYAAQPAMLIPQGSAAGCWGGAECQGAAGLNYPMIQSARLTKASEEPKPVEVQQKAKKREIPKDPMPRHIKSDREFSELDITF